MHADEQEQIGGPAPDQGSAADPFDDAAAALRQGRWGRARAGFEAVLAGQESAEAWEGLAEAAWWLEDASDVLTARQRAYHLFRQRGDDLGAGLVATELGFDHAVFRLELAVANGWFQRAHRLLDELEPGAATSTCPNHRATAIGRGRVRGIGPFGQCRAQQELVFAAEAGAPRPAAASRSSAHPGTERSISGHRVRTCWPVRTPSSSACSCSRACGSPPADDCSSRSATEPAPAPSTSAAAPWGGCGCSANGSARTARSPAPTSTRRCSRPPTRSWPPKGWETSRSSKTTSSPATSNRPPSTSSTPASRSAPSATATSRWPPTCAWSAPGGTVVLEDVDPGSWHFLPPAPAIEERLIPLLKQAFDAAGGDPLAGVRLPRLFRDVDIEPTVRAEVQTLEPGHPYQRFPLQFAGALDGLLRKLVDGDELDRLLDEAEAELADPGRWGLTFTLVQAWGQRAA